MLQGDELVVWLSYRVVVVLDGRSHYMDLNCIQYIQCILNY
jgi:hypothetical protein